MFSAFTDFDGYFECVDIQNIDGTNKFVGPSSSPLDDPIFVAFDGISIYRMTTCVSVNMNSHSLRKNVGKTQEKRICQKPCGFVGSSAGDDFKIWCSVRSCGSRIDRQVPS